MRLVACLTRGFGVTAVTSSPALSVDDNGDGSGAAATVAGAISTATVTVYVSEFGGDLGAASWSAAGQRDGNGALELALDAGHYFGYAAAVDVTGGIAVSPVVYFTVTDGAEAVAFQCLTAAQARIQSLALPDLDGASVLIRKVPLDRYLGANQPATFPAILLTPVIESMPPLDGVNAQDDVTYGVLCTIIDKDNQEPTLAANLPRYTLWRQQIARAFRNQRLPGVTAASGVNPIINAFVEPGDQLIPAAWSANLYASAIVLRFVSREPRGIT